MNQRKAGAILSYISTGLNALIGFVYIPMLLYFLTKEQYGIYQLMGSLIAYLSVMDFGLANTTTRYLARALSLKDSKNFNSIIATSNSLYCIIDLILVAISVIFYFYITPIYSNTLSAEDIIIAKKIFIVMVINIAIFIPSNIFVAIINAHEKFIFLKGLNLIKVLFQPLLVWGVLSYKADVINLVLVQTLFTLIIVFFNYIYCKLKLQISFSFSFSNKQLRKELFSFAFFIFLHSLMDQIYWRIGYLILGAVSGTVAVASYSIAMQISIFAIFLPTAMSGVFLPKLSALIASKTGLIEVNNIFCKLGRLQYMFIMCCLVGFILLGKTFITLWVGDSYASCYLVVIIVVFGYILDISQNVGISILQAMNKHAFRAYIYLGTSILNVILSIILGKKYGEIGCAISIAICLFLGSGLMINWYYNKVGINIKIFFTNMLKLSFPILGAYMFSWAMIYFYPIETSWISFIIHGLLIVSIYGLFMWLFAFNSYEKNLLLEPLNKVKLLLKSRFI